VQRSPPDAERMLNTLVRPCSEAVEGDRSRIPELAHEISLLTADGERPGGVLTYLDSGTLRISSVDAKWS
jgi:hypothetical protein